MNDQATVHIVLGMIFAVAIISITALVGYFARPLSDTAVLFLVMGDVGIAAFNGYYIGNVVLTATSVTATSTASGSSTA